MFRPHQIVPMLVAAVAFALVGHVEWFLPLAAVGSNIFWPVLAFQLRLPNTSARA